MGMEERQSTGKCACQYLKLLLLLLLLLLRRRSRRRERERGRERNLAGQWRSFRELGLGLGLGFADRGFGGEGSEMDGFTLGQLLGFNFVRLYLSLLSLSMPTRNTLDPVKSSQVKSSQVVSIPSSQVKSSSRRSIGFMYNTRYLCMCIVLYRILFTLN